MTVTTATLRAFPAPDIPTPQPTAPTVQPGVMFETSGGHRCNSFDIVFGARGTFECAHHIVLRAHDAREAFLRAGEHR